MPRIEWDESYSVNNEEIDAQHKKWISIINELHDSMMSGDISPNLTLSTMAAMKDYARHHFEFEEEYMKSMDYSGLAEHRGVHGKFNLLIDRYYADIQSGRMVLDSEIMKILMDWLKDHILREDKKYSEYAK